MSDIPTRWERGGLVLPRSAEGVGSEVMGDPCIVWDKEIAGWRMFLFCAPPGHGQAVCHQKDSVGAGQWRFEGPLRFTNPQALIGGGTHKPFVVMQAGRPNEAAIIEGRFCLVTVSGSPAGKVVQQAWATTLAGPWTLTPGVLIPAGGENEFDGRHADAVTGFFFPERGEILYFYMGYPRKPQPHPSSPFGSAQACASQGVGSPTARKLGVVLPPSGEPGHWASGWIGGLQLLPGRTHRWIAVINASPTPPDPASTDVSREEPPPSLGGFAWTDEEWPVRGWQFCPEPIEWEHAIPQGARDAGEGTNFWRQHILVLADGTLALFYNSGRYGNEQMYVKMARAERVAAPAVTP